MEPTNRSSPLSIYFLIGALALLACQKRVPTIMRDGKEISIETAAKQDYDAAETLFSKGRIQDALRIYRSIATDFDRTKTADNALFRIAQIQLRQNQTPKAVSTLETLVMKYPTGDIASLAKLQLGTLYHAQKNYKDAAMILLSIAPESLPDVSRRSTHETLTLDSFDKASMPLEKLRWLISLYDQKRGTFEEPREIARITPIVEAMTNPSDLERLVRERGVLFPASIATYRLAAIYAQLGNPEQAKFWAQTYIEKYPNQTYYRDALALYESLGTPAPIAEVSSANIGVLLPLSGENKVWGDQLWKGLSLAVSPYPNIKLFVEDIADNPQAAERAVHKLVAEKQVSLILGPLTARTSQAAASAALAEQVPIMVWSASEGITKLGDNVFRNSFTKSEQAVGLAYLAYEILGVRRAAILYPQNSYGSEFMQMFWREFVTRGGEVRRIESYDSKDSDVVAPVKRLLGTKEATLSTEFEYCSQEEARKRAREEANGSTKVCFTNRKFSPVVDFEALFLPDGVKRASEFLPTLSFYDVKGIHVLGTNLWNSELLFRGKHEPSVQGAIFLDGAYTSKSHPVVQHFLDQYRRAYQSEPKGLEAQAYDTGLMLVSILSNARPRSPRDFQNALMRIKDFDGTVGKITITENREAHHKLTPFMVDGTEIKEMR